MSKKRGKNSTRNKPPASTPVKKVATAQTTPAASKPVTPQNRAPQKSFPYKTAAIAAVMVLCVAAGAWFVLSPMMEKNKAMEQQNALLDSIEQGDGEIVLDAVLAASVVDFYDGDEETPQPEATDTPGVTEAGGAPDTTAPGETAAPVDTVITGIGILSIDRIDAKLPVTDGVTSTQLKVAVGHVRGTPEIGAEGNSVIAGHRSYTSGQFFNRLGEVAVEDVIRYQPKDGEAMEFLVYEILEVDPGDPAALHQPEDKNIITLLTCTPIRTATHRLLIRAELISE